MQQVARTGLFSGEKYESKQKILSCSDKLLLIKSYEIVSGL